jgi:hypothetical protein
VSVSDGVRPSSRGRTPAAGRVLAVDRVSLALAGVFALAAAFYVWTAGTTYTLALTGAHTDPYNQLANAFLHLHLAVGPAPAALRKLAAPYNPAQYAAFEGFRDGIHDFALYHGNLYLTWGPAPVIVLLVPLHLLGLEPTASVTVSLFAIVGLGFALAILRVILHQVGHVPLWICVLSASTLALASALPFILRRPAVYEEAISGGYCFAMAGVWLAMRVLAERRASLTRLALISLCIGLAAGSRPTLVLTAVVLVPVYLSLRTIRPRRELLLVLTIPLGACILLLLAYNQVRFGSPLEVGTNYQLNGVPPNVTHLNDLRYVLPGLWFYGVNAPRITALFPFILLTPPPTAYPGSLPGLYRVVEPTGGLLVMAPIVIFLAALPWIWRRRSASLGRLASPLLLLGGAGMACALFLAYTFYSATERYEVDFTTLLLLGALAAWLVLSSDTRRRRRRLARIGGGLLASWSCIAGLAISFTGYYNLLATTHRGIWKTLQDVGSPVSRAIATVEGRPELAEVTGDETPGIFVGKQKELVIVSPGTRTAALHVDWVPAIRRGAELVSPKDGATVRIRGPGNAASVYRIRSGGEVLGIPVHLSPGVNRVTITPLPIQASGAGPAIPISAQLLFVESVWLEGG